MYHVIQKFSLDRNTTDHPVCCTSNVDPLFVFNDDYYIPPRQVDISEFWFLNQNLIKIQ